MQESRLKLPDHHGSVQSWRPLAQDAAIAGDTRAIANVEL